MVGSRWEEGLDCRDRSERIRYRAAERQSLNRARVRAFVLVAHGDLRADALAEIFLKALPRVQAIVAEVSPPFIAKIWRDGKVALIDT